MDKLEAILRRAEARRFTEDDYETAKTVLQSYVQLVAMLKDEKTKMHRLRKMLFGASSEKLDHLLDGEVQASASTGSGDTPEPEDESESTEESAPQEDAEPPPRKGHGRHGADAYHGGEAIFVPHESLQPGDSCPECGKGTVYEMPRPGVLIRLTGSAPVRAQVYRLQKLRCGLCGKVFTAQTPAGANTEKHDATVGSMIGLLKYGMGMPFNRFESLQGSVGIPLPASTQWDLVHAQAQRARPIYDELIRQAAAGDVLHNDDTTVKILEWMGKRARRAALVEQAEDAVDDSRKKKTSRSGLFTSGVVSTREGRRIALFFSGRRHAGENLAEVLARRAEELPKPIQMCDALSRNLPGELETILANCLAHYPESSVIWSGLSNHDGSRVFLQRQEKIAPDNGEPDGALRSLGYYAKESAHKDSSRYPRTSRHAAMADKRVGREVPRDLHHLGPAISCSRLQGRVRRT